MVSLLLVLLLIASLPLSLIGALVFIHVALPKKPPMDTSNRINHIRLVWFALTRPDLFIDLFDWLRNDEFNNLNK